jgi:hypothetical protein
LVAGGTQIKVGEPLHSTSTNSSGLATGGTLNSHVLAAADTPVVGTHKFGGIANEDSINVAAGTVAEQFLLTANPVPQVGRIRGKAETSTAVDTLTELALLMQDLVLIDYAATGGSDGGELYTIKDAGSADTSGLELVGGNTALSTLDALIVATAYRHDFV